MKTLSETNFDFAERILNHCLDISRGECAITEEDLMNTANDTESQILFGLLCMHEEIDSNKKITEDKIKMEYETKLLRDKNRELEEFAYKASHDLKEPIRTVFSFSQLLKNMLHDIPDPKVHSYLDYIQVSSKRMTDMISNLLQYARLGNQPKFEVVDTHILLQNIHFDLINQISQAGGKLILGNMPPVVADETLIRLIFQNLISNGLKFSKEGNSPVVKIEGLVRANDYLFSVQDNGVGMSEPDAKDIFDIYKRTNHAEIHYEGAGIGLAHCKKIAEIHQGEIWLKSSIGEGCTFYFTISKKLTSSVNE